VVTPPPQDEDQVVLEAMRSGSQIADVGNELFQLYCRGSYLLDRRTAPSLRAAADAFEAALHMDAEYVPALIGLARAHALLAEYWHVPPGPAFGKARSAVERALRWDQRSSMAHAVLSEIYLFADWDWSKAGRSAWTAIALNPQSAFARNNSAWYYVCRGELDKALGEAQHALIVEPASLQLQLLHARVLVHSGEYERAIRIMSNILEADPEYYAARRYRAQAYVLNAQYSEAIEELTGVPADLSEDLSFRLPLLGRAYAGAGNQHQALDVYAQLRLRSKTEYVPWWNQAIVAAGLHRTDETLHCLSLALRDREPTLLFLRTLRWFRAVEDTARFRRLLRHVGPKQSAGP